jgi:hypothetical protein
MTNEKLKIIEYIKTSKDAVFHYTKLSTAIELILLGGRLKLSLLKDTKDPAEYKDELFLAMRGTGVLSPDDEHRRQEVERMIKSESDKCRVLSFCSNKKPFLMLQTGEEFEDKHGCSNGWEKSRMWSQYAEDHAGICLVFSKEKWEENLKRELGEKQPPIKYKTGYVKYFQHRSEWLNGNRLANGILEEHAINYIEEKSFQKPIDYRDEAEYRTIIFNAEDEKNKYLDINSSINGVIAGHHTSRVYDSVIKELCGNIGIESLKVHWDSGKFVPLPLR